MLKGVCVWQRGGGHAWQGACVVWGDCMAGGMHGGGCAWRAACVAKRGMCGVGGLHGRGHAWQGVCMAGGMRGRVCVAGGMCGGVWGGRGMCGRGGGCAWQERRPLQWTVRILLERILVCWRF